MNQQRITTIVSAIAIVIAVAVVFGANQSDVTAEEKEEFPTASNVKIQTVFKFLDGNEQVDFQVYTQTGGFDREKQSPQFQLIGIVDADRPFLYKIADLTYVRGKNDPQAQGNTYFDVDVSIVKDGVALRAFSYEDCRINSYRVYTDFDKEEAWMGKGFATLDDYTFVCNGYAPKNILMDYMNSPEEPPIKTTSSLALQKPADYTSHPKFQNQK